MRDDPPRRRSSWGRSVALFFIAGAAILGLDRAAGALFPARPVVSVIVPAGLSAEAQRARVDEALLFRLGADLGWLETDPLIRDRLVKNGRFSELSAEGASDDALVAAAMRLGMHKKDPIVRRRVVGRARRMLGRATLPEPSEEALTQTLSASRGRYERPAEIAFTHVFVSRQRRGESHAAHAQGLLARLRAEAPTLDAAPGLGDPWQLGAATREGPVTAIDKAFGRGFGKQVARLTPGRWSGPVQSAYSSHLVWVSAIRPAYLPRLDEVRAAVREQWRDERASASLADRLAAARGTYDVRLELIP